jgi:hypothetical protein
MNNVLVCRAKISDVFTRVRKIAKSDFELRRFCPSVRPSFRPRGRTPLPPDGFLRKLIIDDFFEKFCREIQVPLKSDKNKGHFT